jgi:imidazole glycerol-phosphate synthase subunit HisH
VIVIVDYKTANLGSLVNIFKRIGVAARVAETPLDLAGASRIVLPGIGHFDACARNLRQSGFAEALHRPVIEDRLPLLGICVGAQLLTHGSEEGDEPGLGWVDAFTKRLPALALEGYKVPHMGWNLARPSQPHPLFDGFDAMPRFYFVHSYAMHCAQPASVLATTVHGIEFASAIVHDNLLGVQFHPEKSHRYGMRLLSNFAGLRPEKGA